jgi:RNA polymerase sigma factor (sigma-70 family)
MEELKHGEASDQSLMLAVRAGETAKLGVLFERHHRHLFSFLYHLTGDRQLSEDLVQEVFVRLLKYRHTYRAESQFSTWMFQVARNARTDFFRKDPGKTVSIETDRVEHESPHPKQDEILAADDEMKVLLEAVRKLPEKKREVLLLRGFEGMKFEEIARVLGCPVNTAKARAFDGIRDLRSAVLEFGTRRAS